MIVLPGEKRKGIVTMDKQRIELSRSTKFNGIKDGA